MRIGGFFFAVCKKTNCLRIDKRAYFGQKDDRGDAGFRGRFALIFTDDNRALHALWHF